MFGADRGEQLSIHVTRRESPEASDYWDGNWVCATIRIRAGAFRGEYEALLRANELASFRDQLGMLHDAINGSATFETMEHWLRVDIQGDGRGHFLAKCEARDQPGIGNTLRFELTFDQTELPPVLTALDEVVRAFPVKANP
ncbi:MAG: hypothetical protein ABUL60_12485 [Myxococcales bacterium]